MRRKKIQRGRLKGEGERQVGHRQREPEQLVLAVHDRDERSGHGDRERERRRHRQLQRERALELLLLPLLRLLNERLVDPDALQRDDRHRRDR